MASNQIMTAVKTVKGFVCNQREINRNAGSVGKEMPESTHMKLSQRVNNGTVAFRRQRSQREDRHTDRDILGELRQAAQGAAHGKWLGGIDHYR